MEDWMTERTERLREFFGLNADAKLTAGDGGRIDPPAEVVEGLAHFNIEWHAVPSEEAVPLDDAYFARLYPTAPHDFARPREHAAPSYRERFTSGHAQLQGRVVGVETTAKPRYLPGNRQAYGTLYGHDPSADPFAPYMGRAGMVNGTRYAHNYLSLRAFLSILNEDWRARRILPAGYRATVCPPAVLNLVGTLFHHEWSETETLELGFYRDAAGNATCYAVGSNAPGDFSFVREVEGEAEWSLLGFRVAIIPE
jgi:hypothetical protein